MVSLPAPEILSSTGSNAFCATRFASIAVDTPPTSGSPPPAIAVSYFCCTWAIGIPTYSTSMSGLAFVNSAMMCCHTGVRAGPPLSSQNVIFVFPLPEPDPPHPASTRQAPVTSAAATRDQREIPIAAYLSVASAAA